MADYQVPKAPASPPAKKLSREPRQNKEIIERNIKNIKEFTNRFRGSSSHRRNNTVSSPFAFKDISFVYEAMTPAAALAHGYVQKNAQPENRNSSLDIPQRPKGPAVAFRRRHAQNVGIAQSIKRRSLTAFCKRLKPADKEVEVPLFGQKEQAKPRVNDGIREAIAAAERRSYTAHKRRRTEVISANHSQIDALSAAGSAAAPDNTVMQMDDKLKQRLVNLERFID